MNSYRQANLIQGYIYYCMPYFAHLKLEKLQYTVYLTNLVRVDSALANRILQMMAGVPKSIFSTYPFF